MKYKLKKIDAIIIIALIIIAGVVVLKIDYESPFRPKEETPDIKFVVDDENKKLIVESVSDDVLWAKIDIMGSCTRSYLGTYVEVGDILTDCKGTITLRYRPTGKQLISATFTLVLKPPSSLIIGNERAVSPEDEGAHYHKLLISREWWYFTVVFDEDSELAGWTASISFNHMALGDLFGTLKPDVLVVTLHSPDGKEYGGMINKRRGGGIIFKPTLQATSPGIDIRYEDSWAQGMAPNWHVHAEDKDIDNAHKIILDLDFFSPNSPMWIHSNRLLDKGAGKIAEYIFLGCEVKGNVTIDGSTYNVKGIGHHQHSWSGGLLKLAVKGWDWCHMTLDNGWNIYYSNYYLFGQITPTKTVKYNPWSTVLITTDQGDTLTRLEDTKIEITKSDNLFLLLKMPTEINVTAEPKTLSQFLLKTYDISLNMNILSENTYDKTWKFPTYVGMKIGRNLVTGKLSWTDEDGSHNVDINGVGTIWNMRH